MSKPKKVALLTAGGLAPCLSSAIGSLIERYTEIDPSIEIIAYRGGYKGLLLGDSYPITQEIRDTYGQEDVEAALAEKAREFRELNGEVYQ